MIIPHYIYNYSVHLIHNSSHNCIANLVIESACTVTFANNCIATICHMAYRCNTRKFYKNCFVVLPKDLLPLRHTFRHTPHHPVHFSGTQFLVHNNSAMTFPIATLTIDTIVKLNSKEIFSLAFPLKQIL